MDEKFSPQPNDPPQPVVPPQQIDSQPGGNMLPTENNTDSLGSVAPDPSNQPVQLAGDTLQTSDTPVVPSINQSQPIGDTVPIIKPVAETQSHQIEPVGDTLQANDTTVDPSLHQIQPLGDSLPSSEPSSLSSESVPDQSTKTGIFSRFRRGAKVAGAVAGASAAIATSPTIANADNSSNYPVTPSSPTPDLISHANGLPDYSSGANQTGGAFDLSTVEAQTGGKAYPETGNSSTDLTSSTNSNSSSLEINPGSTPAVTPTTETSAPTTSDNLAYPYGVSKEEVQKTGGTIAGDTENGTQPYGPDNSTAEVNHGDAQAPDQSKPPENNAGGTPAP